MSLRAGALAALEAGHPYLSSHVASCDFSLKLSRPVPDQRRRDAAHYPRCPHLDAPAIEGSGAKRPMATGSRTTPRRSRCCRFQQSGRASAIRGSKACSYEMTQLILKSKSTSRPSGEWSTSEIGRDEG